MPTRARLARLIIVYPLFSELTPKEWVDEYMGEAKRAGVINDYRYLRSKSNAGVQLVTFWVITEFTFESTEENPLGDVYKQANVFANEICKDTDAEVLAIEFRDIV